MLYIDMDYFFAACEEVRHQELKGKPLVVGSSPESEKLKGVVQTCNYEARAFGVHSAMRTSEAYKLNPNMAYVQADWNYYEEISKRIMTLLSGYKARMEADSIDEAVLEFEVGSYEEALAIGKEIKGIVRDKTGLPCTIGISSGKVFAKMVCDSAKPDGLKAVGQDGIKEFLKDRSVGKIPGVGRKTEEKLAAIGIKTIGDLSQADPMVLIDLLGSFGKELFILANGTDTSSIVDNANVVSIGRERTLDSNAHSMREVESLIKMLTKEVIGEVRRNNFVFKSIGVKARYSDFTDRLKSRSLNNYSDSEELVLKTATSLLSDLVKEKPVRKIGVRVSSLASRGGQKSLF